MALPTSSQDGSLNQLSWSLDDCPNQPLQTLACLRLPMQLLLLEQENSVLQQRASVQASITAQQPHHA